MNIRGISPETGETIVPLFWQDAVERCQYLLDEASDGLESNDIKMVGEKINSIRATLSQLYI